MKFNIIFLLMPFVHSFQITPKPSLIQSSIAMSIQTTEMMHFRKLIRSESILPTSLLCFTGGFMMNPSVIGLLQNPRFLVSTVNILFIMSSSMIVNDIFDMNLDKIDHPDRPLVNGGISKNTATGYLLGFLFIVEYLNTRFLPDNLQTIFHLAIINILLYTPIYKKIPFIKNIFCAGMVAFSIFVSGLSASKGLMIVNPGFSILSIGLSVVFFGSWYSEVLLDMGDITGDRENLIYTVPVLYGLKNTWLFSGFLLFFNILSNTFSLSYLFGNRGIGLILPLIFSPMVYDYFCISRESFSTKWAVKNTRKSLFLFVIYLCGLSLFNSGFSIPLPKDIHWLDVATTVFI